MDVMFAVLVLLLVARGLAEQLLRLPLRRQELRISAHTKKPFVLHSQLDFRLVCVQY